LLSKDRWWVAEAALAAPMLFRCPCVPIGRIVAPRRPGPPAREDARPAKAPRAPAPVAQAPPGPTGAVHGPPTPGPGTPALVPGRPDPGPAGPRGHRGRRQGAPRGAGPGGRGCPRRRGGTRTSATPTGPVAPPSAGRPAHAPPRRPRPAVAGRIARGVAPHPRRGRVVGVTMAAGTRHPDPRAGAPGVVPARVAPLDPSPIRPPGRAAAGAVPPGISVPPRATVRGLQLRAASAPGHAARTSGGGRTTTSDPFRRGLAGGATWPGGAPAKSWPVPMRAKTAAVPTLMPTARAADDRAARPRHRPAG